MKKRIALGSDHCDICIHRKPQSCEDIIGDEYFSDGIKVIAEVRAPSELQKRIEERLHSLWVKDNPHPVDEHISEPPGLIAQSDAMMTVLKSVEIVAPTRVPVLITGETGVGKEIIARSIHAMSPRNEHAFIAVNCGSIPQELVETELFGHEAGAFTDAKSSHEGKFERADKGTLFLDEINSLPLKAQVSLLRVLQENRFERIGGKKQINCDVRVIAASNQDLSALVECGQFRRDLFYRLNVVPLDIPPLRERPEDLRPLVDLLMARFAGRYQTAQKSLTTTDFPLCRNIRGQAMYANWKMYWNARFCLPRVMSSTVSFLTCPHQRLYCKTKFPISSWQKNGLLTKLNDRFWNRPCCSLMARLMKLPNSLTSVPARYIRNYSNMSWTLTRAEYLKIKDHFILGSDRNKPGYP